MLALAVLAVAAASVEGAREPKGKVLDVPERPVWPSSYEVSTASCWRWQLARPALGSHKVSREDEAGGGSSCQRGGPRFLWLPTPRRFFAWSLAPLQVSYTISLPYLSSLQPNGLKWVQQISLGGCRCCTHTDPPLSPHERPAHISAEIHAPRPKRCKRSLFGAHPCHGAARTSSGLAKLHT